MFKMIAQRLAPKLTPVSTKNAPAPAFNAYSQAMKVNNMIFVSGQVPYTPDGQKVEGDFKAKSKQVLENVKNILEASNSSLNHVVKVNAFLTDMSNFADFNAVYTTYFDTHKPARSAVAVKTLPLDSEVEVEVIAVEKE